MTGYALAKLVNSALAEEGLKPIPPQMVYNYIRKGYIEASFGDVPDDAAASFIETYVANRIAKATKA